MKLLFILLAAIIPGEWQHTGDVDGVSLYSRDTPGSPFHSMKGSGIVDAPARMVAQVLLDDVHASDWVDSLAEARVVRVLAPDEYIEYNHVSMPPLVRDREFVTDVRMGVDPAAQNVVIESRPAEDPSLPPNGHVRGLLRAVYEIQSIEAGKRCRLTVELHADPKGLLPAWLVNFFQKDSVRITIQGIRKQVQKDNLAPPPEFKDFLAGIAF